MDDYISREETVKAFCEKCRGYYDGHCVHRGECDVDVIQNAPSCVPQWISVKDKLPEPFATVLAYSINGRMYTVGYIDKLVGFMTRDTVTHWMPLPEPPKEPNAE